MVLQPKIGIPHAEAIFFTVAKIEMSKFAIWLGEKYFAISYGYIFVIWIPLAMFISQLLSELREKHCQKYPNDKKNPIAINV